MTDEIKRIALNGVELGYSTPSLATNKLPLIFVHGYSLRSTAGPYEALLELLAHHHAVYALDFRGHGASANAVEGWSHEALADDVVAFARELKLDRPVLASHSFGGFISLFAEIRHPGTFSALCLLSPGPSDPTRDPVDTLAFLIEHGHDRDKLKEGFRKMFVRPPGRLLDNTIDAVTLVDAGTHRRQREQNSKVSIDDRLKNVNAPVLLLCGRNDTVVPLANHEDMASKLKLCKEVVYSGEGHMLPSESPEIAVREILMFLDHDRRTMAVT